MRRSARWMMGCVLGAAAGLAAIVWWNREDAQVAQAPATATGAPSSSGVRHTEQAAPSVQRREAPRPEAEPGRPPTDESLPETAWANVDLDAIREVMPDNLFWTMAAPTTDPDVIARRDETRERWNAEWGKILSNTATAEEIDAYYAERQQLAQDYVDFATFLLTQHGEQLTVRDVGLLKVAVELNLARLEGFPREIADAHARREAHDAARRAWREQQDLFEGE